MIEGEIYQARQMRLVESEQAQRYEVVAPLIISLHVLGHQDRYSEAQIHDAQERIQFWGALSAAQPDERDFTQP